MELLLDALQAEFWEVDLDLIAGDVVQQSVGLLAVRRVLQHHGALTDVLVGGEGEEHGSSGRFVLRGEGDGLRHEGEFGVAAEGELRGLADGFGLNQVWGYVAVVVEFFQGGECGAAVGGVVGVGDGDAPEIFAFEGVQVERLEAGVVAGPEYEDAFGVGGGVFGVGQVGGDDALGEDVVGGEEDVGGRAVNGLL